MPHQSLTIGKPNDILQNILHLKRQIKGKVNVEPDTRTLFSNNIK